MSGLCGAAWWSGAPAGEAAVEAMVAAVPYRATGGRGVVRGRRAVLGQLVRSGAPDADPAGEGELWAVADARWDGRGELSSALAAEGVRPPAEGSSPAAWALAAYRAWGRGCVERLRGDFAFAVWDGRREALFAARDPMGMRQLVWRGEPGRVWVATEPKQIRAAVPEAGRVDERTVAAYLAGRDLPPTWTYWAGIERLAPGGALWAEAGGVRTWRWGTVAPEGELRYGDEAEYVAHFRELFADAVRERTRDGTPVGLMLSGGVDSSSVAAVAGWLADRGEGEGPPLRTYQWAFEGMPACDEREVSRRVAGRWGLPQVEVPVEGAWPLAGGLAHGPDPDEPFAGIYQPLIDRTLARAADDGCRRLLSGDRGDLVMGEYIYDFPALALSGRWARLWSELRELAELRGASLPDEARRQLLRPLRHRLWPPERSGPVRDAVRRLRRAVRPREPRLPPWVEPAFLRRTGILEHRREDPARERELAGLRGYARKARYRAVTVPLHMRGMGWSERSWARHGLEFADAWSDVRLARFALAVPQRVLNRVGEDKRLVRRTVADLVPDAALRGMGKRSPAPLLYRALREEEVETMEWLLSDMAAADRGWLREEPLREHYREIREGGGVPGNFWFALNVEMWLRAAGADGRVREAGPGSETDRPVGPAARASA